MPVIPSDENAEFSNMIELDLPPSAEVPSVDADIASALPAAVAESNAALVANLATNGLTDDAPGFLAALNAYDAARGLQTPSPRPVTSDLASLASLAAVNAAAPTATAGSIRSGGFVAPTARSASFDESALTSAELAIRAVNQARSAVHRVARAAIAPVVATIPPVETPTIDRGILPRSEVLSALVAQSAGVGITFERSERNAGSMPRQEITNLLVGTEFAGWEPGIKSTKRQLGEVMRTLVRSADLAVRAITRKDLSRSGREWPATLESRHTVSTVDGTDDLGSSGAKILIVDLVESADDATGYRVVFTGGNETLRERVSGALAARCGDQSMTATDLLGWFRGILESKFEAMPCAGMIYAPGDSAKLDRFVALIAPKMLREIAIHDMISGLKLSKTLMQGLNQKLAKIEADWSTDCIKAREREMQKVRDQNESHTQADLDAAALRAVVLPERAGTYLGRLIDCHQLLTGLSALLGDDTAAVRERFTAIRSTIEPLCDDTTRMAANIELDATPSNANPVEDLPQGPSMLELD